MTGRIPRGLAFDRVSLRVSPFSFHNIPQVKRLGLLLCETGVNTLLVQMPKSCFIGLKT